MSGALIDTLAFNFTDDSQYKDKSFAYHDYIFDKSQRRDGIFSRFDFAYDLGRDPTDRTERRLKILDADPSGFARVGA